jgi:group II intron reverse transcriptase/maturase
MSTKRQRIAQLAKQSPQMTFTSLNHYLDVAWLRAAFYATRKDGAPGVDGQTWHEYEQHLEDNLQSLLDRALSGTYRAPPVRRVHIPKGTSTTETRPIGIPTLEDKVLQRAVVMVLESIFEQDFYDCSYGFRPKRSAHGALASLWKQAMGAENRWILEVDIRKFFDTLDHGYLWELLQLRVRDGVLLRLIGKWLHAGVMEAGELSYPEQGTPQGGVISPLLANVYLHYVLDVWFHTEVVPRLRGRAWLIRYADDFVIGFVSEADARRVMEVLPKRFARFGLTIHPDKTRLIPFASPRPDPPSRGEQPGTFTFLGFTHYWGRSRRGRRVIMRQTASNRLTRSLQAISAWCRAHRHDPLTEQHERLRQKVAGHYAYYGITGNYRSLASFYEEVRRIWYKWLSRRRRKNRPPWSWFLRLISRYALPRPRITHSVYRGAKA